MFDRSAITLILVSFFFISCHKADESGIERMALQELQVKKEVEPIESFVGIRGTEIPQVKKFPAYECRVYNKYVVLLEPTKDSPDDYITVILRDPIEDKNRLCNRDSTDKYYSTIGTTLLGIYGDYLFIDDGCCPGTRGLSIISLSEKKRIYDTSYSDHYPIIFAKDLKLIFYKETETKATIDNCSYGKEDLLRELGKGELSAADEDYLNLMYGIDNEVIIDLKTLTEIPTGKYGCSFRQ